MRNRYSLLLALLLTIIGFGQVHAKEDIDIKKLPTLLGNNNAGTDFWVSFPVCYAFAEGKSGLKIYVSSGTKTKVTLEIPRFGLKLTKTTIPNDVIEFDLSPGQGQPYEKDPNPSDEYKEKVYQGAGVHIYADAPIIVYGVTRFTATSDSFLGVPVSAWGKEYIVASMADMTAAGPFTSLYLPSQTNIIAAYDNTVVTFTLGGMPGTKTVGGMSIGQRKTFTMKKGDVVSIANKKTLGNYFDLSGSKITSTKPVGVVSGNQCAYVPETTQACDFIMEMELPTNTWGKEYHVTRIRSRKEYSLLKIFAKEPNTKIYRDDNPTPFAVISNAGGVEGSGYIKIRSNVDGSTPRPIVIRADKPINVTQYNPGSTDDGILGDPFQMVLTPIQQYQKEVTFNTPGIKGGKGFAENYMNIVFQANDDGTMPDDLEFATVDNGSFVWKSVKSIFGATAEPFKQIPGDTRKFFSKIVSLPGDGVYKIRANKPFAGYAYGADYYDSYGHPVSVALGDLTKNDPDTPVPTYTLQCDGSVTDGMVEDLPKVETAEKERSNMSLITLIEGSENYILEKEDFEVGAAVKAWWKLSVEDPTKDAIANVYFSDRAGNDTTIQIKYAAPAVTVEPGSVNFGLLKTNEAGIRQVVIRNTSLTMPQNITGIELSSKGTKEFTITNMPTLPFVLEPEKSLTLNVQFISAVEGENFKDSVIVEVNDCYTRGTELLARVGEPVIEVTNVPFGVLPVNASLEKSMTVTNAGKVELIITGASDPKGHPIEFTKSGNGWNITPATPLILPPGGTQNLSVTFKASAEGDYIDTVFFTSNATRTKNYSELTAKTIKGNLGVVGYTWPRKRTNKSYDDGFIVLTNYGTAPVTITNSFKKGADAASFSVPAFGNETIEPNGTKTIPNVVFTPGRTGTFEAQVEFETQDGNVVADLKGIGIEPRLSMEPLKDFGRTAVGASTPNQRTVTITCEEYEWQDSVTITDLTATPNGGVSWTTGTYGSEGFSFDKASFLNGGLVLQPGQPATMNVDFVAQRGGAASVTVRPSSDAVNNDQVQSVWNGFGNTSGLNSIATTDNICINADGTIIVTIENPGNQDAVIQTVAATSPSPATAKFEVVTALPVTIAAGQTTTVTLRVSSPVEGKNTATVVINDGESQVNVSFDTKDYSRMSSISKTITADVGETKSFSIMLDNGESFDLADVSRLDVSVSYKPEVVQVEQGSITTSVPGFRVDQPIINAAAGTVSFSLVPDGTAAVLPKSGELTLATMKFTAYLNGKPEDSSPVTQTVTVVGTECLKIESTPGLISVNPVCGGDVRRIAVSGNQYALMSISPNPVTSGVAEVTFSVGLKGYTTIEVINAMGVVVGTLVNQELLPGTYTVPMNISTELSSGMYYYRIVSGPYTETKKVMIAR